MGHWAVKDKMPGVYDATRHTTELIYKKFVVDNIVAGWRPVDDGNIPLPASIPLMTPAAVVGVSCATSAPPDILTAIEDAACTAPSPLTEHSPTVCTGGLVRLDGSPFLTGAELQVRVSTTYVIPDSACQVLNDRVGTVHLYTDGHRTWCGGYTSGSPSNPTSTATFALSNCEWSGLVAPFSFCRQCLSQSCLLKHGALPCPERDPSTLISAPGSSSSSSEVDSDSESST